MNIADVVRRQSCEAWEYVILFEKIRGIASHWLCSPFPLVTGNNHMTLRATPLVILLLSCLLMSPVANSADRVIYQGSEGPGVGKHILFIAS
ncbi:MAG: hypothetical protein VYB72_08740, partial [Planctomycetota bacterium]|nr:hypothetical protein [Planctomycetota bacterium]